MSLVDVLLNSDVNEVLAEKTEEYEVERLSKVLGEKFVLTNLFQLKDILKFKQQLLI